MDRRLYDILTDIFQTDDIDSDTSFEELYADLQDMQEVLMAVSEEFDVDADLSDALSLRTVADLEEYAERLRNARE